MGTDKEPKRSAPKQSSLAMAGFKQVFFTARNIVRYYPSTLMWFLLAVMFAEATIFSFLTVAVTFIVGLGISGNTLGLLFIEVSIFHIPGSLFSSILTKRVSHITNIKINLILFMVINFVSFSMLANPENKNLVFIFAILWGFMIGWIYPAELNIFSSLMPKGQEAELAGFYLYCTQLMAWLPPLVFTLFNENPNISLSWAGVQLNIYLFLALVFYQLMPSWEKCLEITNSENMILKSNTEDIEEKVVEGHLFPLKDLENMDSN